MGGEVKHKASMTRQTQGSKDAIMEYNLVDMEGKAIGKSFKEIVDLVPKTNEANFWNYYLHQHNISRAAQGKRVFAEFSAEDSKAIVDDILKTNPEYKKIAKEMTDWTNTLMNAWGKDIIGKDTLSVWRKNVP